MNKKYIAGAVVAFGVNGYAYYVQPKPDTNAKIGRAIVAVAGWFMVYKAFKK